MKVLYIGESWLGSCARSVREGIVRTQGSARVLVDEIGEDLFIPKPRTKWLRALNRVANVGYTKELSGAIRQKFQAVRPDVVIAYKGSSVSSEVISSIREQGAYCVNIFPDYSPHAYGLGLKRALGEYNLVISTKAFHPPLWQTLYAYGNECIFIPHGYDPLIHLYDHRPTSHTYDVGLIANWRPEYDRLVRQLARMLPPGLRVAIGGFGWMERARCFARDWHFPGELFGISYSEFVRRCAIVIAPVNSEVVIDGVKQPGDEETTRTYELAAANCFFIHRRTPTVQALYAEDKEVPMYQGAEDLTKKIIYFLDHPNLRDRMAQAAHRVVVPAHSTDARASAIMHAIGQRL